MHADPLTSLVAISIAAFLVPLVIGLLPRSPVPAIVGEVAAGIALGPSLLGLVAAGEFVDFLFLFGLAFLLFLAGFEIDFVLLLQSLAGDYTRSPVVLAVVAFVVRVAIALAIAFGLQFAGIVDTPLLVAVLLVSTSLGIVLSVLKERGLSTHPFGQAMLVATAIADLGTVLLLTVLFSTEGRTATAQLALVALMLFAGIVLLLSIRMASRIALVALSMQRHSGATSQLRVRGSLALLLVLVGLASELGLELILGAFMAGAIMSSVTTGAARDQLSMKLDAVGYGFFVPVFFVVAGSRVDLRRLLDDPEALLLVPALVAAAVAVKLPAGLVFARSFGVRLSTAAGLLQTAQLTLTIAGVEIGERLGLLDSATGSALIIVALITVILAPLLFALVAPPFDTATGEPT